MNNIPDVEVRMSVSERNLFEKSISHKPVYLEFGCGGSTEIAVKTGCPTIFSVESDLAWIQKLSERKSISDAIKNNVLHFKHVDIGPVGAWGAPKDESKIRNWPAYCLAPFGSGLEYRFIFVDGRFRTACAYACWAFMLDDAVMAVHDYTVREDYYAIEKFFNLVDRVDTLVVMTKKRIIVDESYVKSLLESLFNF